MHCHETAESVSIDDPLMLASIGRTASPSQGMAYFERDGHYVNDDAAHRESSACTGRVAQSRSPVHTRAVIDSIV